MKTRIWLVVIFTLLLIAIFLTDKYHVQKRFESLWKGDRLTRIKQIDFPATRINEAGILTDRSILDAVNEGLQRSVPAEHQDLCLGNLSYNVTLHFTDTDSLKVQLFIFSEDGYILIGLNDFLSDDDPSSFRFVKLKRTIMDNLIKVLRSKRIE